MLGDHHHQGGLRLRPVRGWLQQGHGDRGQGVAQRQAPKARGEGTDRQRHPPGGRGHHTFRPARARQRHRDPRHLHSGKGHWHPHRCPGPFPPSQCQAQTELHPARGRVPVRRGGGAQPRHRTVPGGEVGDGDGLRPARDGMAQRWRGRRGVARQMFRLPHLRAHLSLSGPKHRQGGQGIDRHLFVPGLRHMRRDVPVQGHPAILVPGRPDRDGVACGVEGERG